MSTTGDGSVTIFSPPARPRTTRIRPPQARTAGRHGHGGRAGKRDQSLQVPSGFGVAISAGTVMLITGRKAPSAMATEPK